MSDKDLILTFISVDDLKLKIPELRWRVLSFNMGM